MTSYTVEGIDLYLDLTEDFEMVGCFLDFYETVEFPSRMQ